MPIVGKTIEPIKITLPYSGYTLTQFIEADRNKTETEKQKEAFRKLIDECRQAICELL